MKLKFTLVFFIVFSFFSFQKTFSQCFQIESILVDACGPDEGLNEMVRFKVGSSDINTSNISVTWPSNSWQGLVKNITTGNKVAALNAEIIAAGGCGRLIEPTSGVLPANAKVILITSFNVDVTTNVFGAITDNIYVIFQNNATTTAGHFVNYNATSVIRTLVMSFGLCSDTVSYDKSLLININGTSGGSSALNDGASVNYTPSGAATYVNKGCVAPVEVFSVDAGNSPISACAGAKVSLSGTAVGQQSVAWTDGSAGGTFTMSSALGTDYTISSSASGTITLTLTATNPCSISKTSTVTLNVSPTITPTFNAIPHVCQNGTAPTLPTSSTNVPPISGTWNSTVSTANVGTITYTFTPNGVQCASIATLDVTVDNCGFGSFASAAWLNNCTTPAGQFYNITGTGANLINPSSPEGSFMTPMGSFIKDSGALIFKGGEIKTFKNTLGNVCGAKMFYNIHLQSDPAGTFTPITLNFFSDCISGAFQFGGGPCSPRDQKWQTTSNSVDLTALPKGNYVLEVYYTVSGSSVSTSGCNDTVTLNNGGINYLSSFSINAPTYSSSNPTTCGGSEGTITISGLTTNTIYSLSYNNGATTVGPTNLTSNASGAIIITGLSAGTYSNFSLAFNSCSSVNNTPIILVNPVLNSTITKTDNTVCQGTPGACVATGTHVVLNEVMHWPATGQGLISSGTEYIELYNPTCSPIDLSCYIIGTRTAPDANPGSSLATGGSIILPQGTSIAAKSHYVIGTSLSSSNPLSVDFKTDLNASDYCTTGNFVMPNGDGWVALYSANGTPVDAIYWTVSANQSAKISANDDDLNDSPCTPSSIGGCNTTGVVLASATQIYSSTPSSINYVGATTPNPLSPTHKTFSRIPDGGTWQNEIAPSIDGVNCNNGNCDTPSASTCNGTATALPTDGSGSYSYLWNDASAQTTATATGLCAGNYCVKVTDLVSLCTTNKCVTIVDAATLPAFNSLSTAAPSICAGGTAEFILSGTANAIITYTINGGTAQTISLDASGNATVKVIGATTDTTILVTNINLVTCNVTLTNTITVTISTLADAGTLSGNQTICSNATSTFTSTRPNGIWTSSDSSIATIDNAGLITVVSAGTATITYTVLGTGSCPDAIATRTITITAAPNAGVLSGNQAICINGTSNFSSTQTGGTWTSSDVTVATINSSGIITPIAAGTVTMSYTVTGTGGCSDATATRTITITNAPNAGVLSGIQTICSNGTTTFTSSQIGGTWSSSNIGTATVDNAGLITAVSGGTATITYTILGSGGCPDAIATRTITVTAAPNAGVLSGNQAICINGTSNFSSTQTGGTWTSSDVTIATINSSGIITPNATGTVTIAYTVKGTGGCTDAIASRTITISALANAGIISGTDTICSNGTTTFSSTQPNGSWSSSETSIATINSAGIITGISSGTSIISYTVTGIGGCPNAVATKNVSVSNPLVSITADCIDANYTLTAITKEANPTFNWFKGTTALTETSNTLIVKAVDNYKVIVTSNGCTAEATENVSFFYCDIPRGISPNGDNKNDFFDLSNLHVNKLEIFNRYGVKVYSKSNYKKEWNGTTDSGQELPDATYFYVIEFESGKTKTGWVFINK